MGSEVNRLPGMQDVTGGYYDELADVSRVLTSMLRNAGYKPLDTPLLEDTELFVRKSGGALTGNLYTFFDPGGNQISLRPEFTSSVIRHFVQESANLNIPVRWYYDGPVFRYEYQKSEELSQSTQIGAELIGSAGVEAEIEVLSLAWQGLVDLGIGGQTMRVGHVGLLFEAVKSFGLSDSAAQFILRNVPDLKKGNIDAENLVCTARDVGLLGGGTEILEAENLSEDGRQLAQEYVRGVLTRIQDMPRGRRSAEDIVERLVRKGVEKDSSESFRQAIELTVDIVTKDGDATAVLELVAGAVPAEQPVELAIEELRTLCESLVNRGVDLMIDLGLVREIAYYTGVIFEIGDSSGSSICGGGRYDGLIKALGGGNTEALGFAYDVDKVVEMYK